MKYQNLNLWQLLAFISGAIITIVMALASISYNATLGTDEPAFALLPITNRALFSSLALAFDLGMIASVFGFWYWLKSNLVAAFICVPLFAIASLFSIHSVHGYIAINITKSLAPVQRQEHLYGSLKQELLDSQIHLSALRTSLLKTSGQRRIRLRKEIAQQVTMIDGLRARITSSKIVAPITPLSGLEWFLAVTLWFFNATCWTAWFGTASHIPNKRLRRDVTEGAHDQAQSPAQDSVRSWLGGYRSATPDHCAQLFKSYMTWCERHDLQALGERKFYQRLISLGARKFRDGRNGPTKYELPHSLTTRDGVKL